LINQTPTIVEALKETINMKMVMIVYNEAVGDEVMEILETCAMKNYTKLVNVFGKGASSGTHLGNDIWPGRNNLLYVACDEAQAKKMLNCVRGLRKTLGPEGIKAFSWNLEEMT
jgi:nitrogen regulatory protein PII